MGNAFESQQGYGDDLEIGLDNFKFKSAGKKYLNQNYKRIGAILGVEGEGLGVIKKQANRENKLPDIHGEIGLEQINFYRAHYDFSPLTQDEYETVKAQNTSSEAIIDEQVEEVTEVEKTDIDISSDEGEKVESSKTLTRKDFGPMPEDPYNIKNNDLEALNSFFDAKPDQFPNGRYVNIKNWADWTPITVVRPEKTNDSNPKWSITKGNNNELIREFDSEQRAETEFKRIKDIDKQKALGLLRKARNFAIGEDLDTPWTNATDVGSETPSSAKDTTPIDSVPERLAYDARVSEDPTPVEYLEVDQDTKGDEVSKDKLPGAEALQAELDRLIEESVEKEDNKVTETVGKLARIEGREYTGEVDSEEIVSAMEVKILRENARQSILEYQKFIEINRNNLKDEKIYNQYRIIEKKAWSQVSKFTYQLGGEMATLSQERDIQLAHPEVVNIEKYLVDGGKIVLDAEGHITHLNINGNIIELNRPRTIDELLRAPRPTRILYHSGTPISADDPTKQNYKGLVISGLNENTLEWIEGVLSDKQFLESVIVDETTQQNPELDGNQEEVAILGNAENVLDSETVTQSPEQAEGVQMILSNKENTVDFEVVDDPESAKLLEEMEPIDLVDRLAELREQYARAEEAWNRKRGDEKLEDAFIVAREAYNTELERVLKLQVAKGQETNIHQIFKDEVIALRDSRIDQSQELQGKWEKRFNNAKEKFLGWATKNRKIWMGVNLGLIAVGTGLSLTGVGIPLALQVDILRRSIGSAMSGVGVRNTLVGLMEDRDIRINKGFIKINFQAVVPKIVRESISESEEQIKQVSDEVLKDRLGTLDAYYRLNGGKFDDNQQKAYEKVLTELARRVQENVIDAEQNQDELKSDWQEQKPQELTDDDIENLADENWEQKNILSKAMPLSRDREINKQYDLYYKEYEDWKKSNPEKYTSELLNTISDKRITELDKFRRKRKIATVAGVVTTGVLGGLLLNDMVKPGSMFSPDIEGSGTPPTTGGTTPEVQGAGAGPSGTSAPEAGASAPKLNLETTPPTGTGADAGEALRQVQEAAAATEQAQELARDVSSLDSGETIWGELTKQLGENASQSQIQQAVENYLQSELGQESLYKLAQGTEGGRELLSQWGIDNIGEMSSLSKEQLFEISKYLAPGELEGLTELSLDNLNALDQAVAPEVTEAPTIEPASSKPPSPTAGPEITGSEPPAPPSAEAPVPPPAPEASPVASTEFTKSLSKALGTTNLTETQLQEAIYSFATSEQGSVDLYNQIISNEEGARFLSGFGVDKAADFANIRPDRLYEIAQTVGVENLDKLPGFELNEIILSKFEDAPDMVELSRGTRPLDVVQRYIANELGNLPYDSNLGKQVLDTYIQTDTGKQWLYDAIVSNPNPNNQNVQLFREYLRFKGITSPDQFVEKFNWAEFSGNRNIPTSGFWNQIRLPNGGSKLQPLSTFLQPSKMTGIPEVIKQVLTRQ